MPNQPDTNNRNLCVRVTRELYYKVRKAAKKEDKDMAVFVRDTLGEAVFKVNLSAEEIQQIAKEVKNAEEKRKRN